MADDLHLTLSKRERQIMDLIYQLGEASVGDVLDKMPEPTVYNSVRILMGILEKKGYLEHRQEKNKYIYYPTLHVKEAKKSILDHVLTIYFQRSVPNAVSTLLSHKKISAKELDELSDMIEAARKKQSDE